MSKNFCDKDGRCGAWKDESGDSRMSCSHQAGFVGCNWFGSLKDGDYDCINPTALKEAKEGEG